MISAEAVGKNVLSSVQNSAGALNLFLSATQNLPALNLPPVRRVLLKQVYFTGSEALGKISLIGALIGVVIITQISNIVGLQSALTGKILVWTVVRELGPLFCAIIIIARSCTAIASELGAMKLNGETDALRTMGIDPVAYLIVPRILGVTLSVFILTFYFQIFAMAGGLLLSALITDIPLIQHMENILAALDLFEISISSLKSLVFGFTISTVSCFHGLRVKSSITELPQMTTVAVMQSLFMVLIFDGIITVASYV